MIILEKPYVSDFLIETIKKNNYNVLDNEVARSYFNQDELLTTKQALDYYNSNNLIYSNSENSITWIDSNLSLSEINRLIRISKDKIDFRKTIAKLYPDYFFKEVKKDELRKIDPKNLVFPLILKPAVGFLSFGVYPIENLSQWNKVLDNLECDIEKFSGIFPKNVVDTTNFIIEEMIEGEEYALDAYFDKNNEAQILNIFSHPFFDKEDVSDRAYYTSKEIIQNNLSSFKKMLDRIGRIANYKNFPFHLELRIDKKTNTPIPIELNPMRFCGWCITDIANYAWGINVYEYYFNQTKPDWDNILKNKDNSYYYFTIGDIPSSIDKTKIQGVDYQKYLSNIENPLEIRKIDYKTNPVFAIVFAKTKSLEEIRNILKLDMKEFINL